MPDCINGQGYRENHAAEGYLCAPDGRRIAPQCLAHANAVIAEYAEKLGECWTFAENVVSGVATAWISPR